jgi:hypothetical protein
MPNFVLGELRINFFTLLDFYKPPLIYIFFSNILLDDINYIHMIAVIK